MLATRIVAAAVRSPPWLLRIVRKCSCGAGCAREIERLRWSPKCPRVGRGREVQIVNGACFVGTRDCQCKLGIRDLELRCEAASLAKLRESESLECFGCILAARGECSAGSIELGTRGSTFTGDTLPRLRELKVGEPSLRVGQPDRTLRAKAIEERETDLDSKGSVAEPAAVLSGADSIGWRIGGTRNRLEAASTRRKSIERKRLRADETRKRYAGQKIRLGNPDTGVTRLRDQLG